MCGEAMCLALLASRCWEGRAGSHLPQEALILARCKEAVGQTWTCELHEREGLDLLHSLKVFHLIPALQQPSLKVGHPM